MPRRRTKSPVSGLKRVRAKGRLYWYHRATGIRLTNDPNTAAGLIEINALDECATSDASSQGSLAHIIEAYQAPDAGRAGRILPFRKLSERTQADYQECIDYLEPAAAELFPADMKPRQVQKLVDDAADLNGWVFGDKLLRVLRLMMNWGVYHELTAFKSHPCKDVLPPARDEHAPEANRPWTETERIVSFTEATRELAILFGLCLYAQLNIAHAIDIPPSAIKIERRGETVTRRLKWRRAKNCEPIDVEITGPLEHIINACSKTGPTLALNSRGDPWTYAGANTSRKRLMARLVEQGKVETGLTFHGLRATLGAVAAEGTATLPGATDKQIAAAIHDKTSVMGAHYSRSAEKRKLAEVARRPLNEIDGPIIGPILAARFAPQPEGAKVVKLKTA